MITRHFVFENDVAKEIVTFQDVTQKRINKSKTNNCFPFFVILKDDARSNIQLKTIKEIAWRA